MKKRLRTVTLMLAVFWSVIIMPGEALAYELLTCTNGQPVAGSALFYTDEGATNSFCQYSDYNAGLDHIFSRIACNFTGIVNDVLGKMYCGIQQVLKPLVAILLTLYIMIFGVQLLMGTAQLTIREGMTRLLKIALVWTFVNESTLAIGLVFAFFVDLANQGVWWAVTAIHNAPFQMNPTAFGGMGDVMPAYSYIDQMIFQVITGPFMAANNELVAFFCLMGYLMPPIFMIALYWLLTTFKILARALISFLMAISALAFLISLSPIFLSLMLFKATTQFFESWFRFLISYSLQIAIVFACIAMWSMAFTQFTGFFSELAAVIFPSNKIWVWAAPVADPTQSLGVCPYKMTLDPATNQPHIGCTKAGFDPSSTTNPSGWRTDKAKLIMLSDLAQKAENEGSQQTALNELIYFVFYYMISMIIICYAFDALLRKAPEIARQLAGPEYVPILGQGYGYTSYGQVGKEGASRQAYLRQTPDSGGDGGGLFSGARSAGGGNIVGDSAASLARLSNQR